MREIEFINQLEIFMDTAKKLRDLAATIRTSQGDSEATARGFELIAGIMKPCMDCGALEAVDLPMEARVAESGDMEASK